MKTETEPRYPELIGLRFSREQANEIRRQARLDDRTVSGYLRRLIASALPKPTGQQGQQ